MKIAKDIIPRDKTRERFGRRVILIIVTREYARNEMIARQQSPRPRLIDSAVTHHRHNVRRHALIMSPHTMYLTSRTYAAYHSARVVRVASQSNIYNARASYNFDETFASRVAVIKRHRTHVKLSHAHRFERSTLNNGGSLIIHWSRAISFIGSRRRVWTRYNGSRGVKIETYYAVTFRKYK